jgi:hypothetical protein
MKKLYPLLSVLFLIYWGCEEEQEVDTTPPTVTITYPQNGSTVYEIITITCMSSDNEEVEKVELWVNGVTTGLTDNTEPYSFDWNTTTLEDGNYTIIIRSYDTSDNTTDSEPVVLTIDNSLSVPQGGNITSVTYTTTEMTVEWEQSSDGDFNNYKVLYSEIESGNKDTIQTYTDISTTSYTITEFDPTHDNWFWVQVTDTLGFSSIGSGMTNEIDSPPTPSELYPITYNDGFQISWSQNNDDDFVSYKLYELLSENMNDDTLIYETDDRTDTTYFKTILNYMYYKIVVEDVWGLQSTSNIKFGDYFVELWGESYSVPNTTELELKSSGLTGEIPPEIGNLTNLTYLRLSNNQLSGSIPSEIGNLTNLTYLELGVNELMNSIPPEIGNLTNLTVLDLNNNQLTGSIPSEIGNLTNLTLLILNDNQLTGSIPSEIGNLTNLDYLWLTNNQLTGSIPLEIGNLTNLTWLFLNINQLTGSIPSEIGNLTYLQILRLSGNQLTGEIPESICDLNYIHWSSYPFSNNQLCPPYPSCVEDYVGEQDTSGCD